MFFYHILANVLFCFFCFFCVIYKKIIKVIIKNKKDILISILYIAITTIIYINFDISHKTIDLINMIGLGLLLSSVSIYIIEKSNEKMLSNYKPETKYMKYLFMFRFYSFVSIMIIGTSLNF